MWQRDREILRGLASELAEIAALPIQEKVKKQWYALNALKPERPMYLIGEDMHLFTQLPWNELEYNDELKNRCTDEFAQWMETVLRRQIYMWNHVRDDYVYEPCFHVPMKIEGISWGVEVEEDVIQQGEGSDVYSHRYHDLLRTEEDLDKLKMPHVRLNKKETAIREEKAHDVMDGILEVKMDGYAPSHDLWDDLVRWRGLDNMFYDMVDRPEFIHKTIDKLTQIQNAILDQCEEQNLLSTAHIPNNVAGYWTDLLPQKDFDPKKVRVKDIWGCGKAQIFATVSPEVHNEFDIEYSKGWYERFGLVVYGCCEPLDDRLEYVKRIKNVRKISISPWVKNRAKAAEELGSDYIFWAKPSPSFLEETAWDPVKIKEDILDYINICQRFNTPLELALKDVSTVSCKPENLWEWSRIMRSIVGY
jgi:hypothetical protein